MKNTRFIHFIVMAALMAGLTAFAQDNRSKIALDRAENASKKASQILAVINSIEDRIESLENAIAGGDPERVYRQRRLIETMQKRIETLMNECQTLLAEAQAATQGLQGAAKNAAQSAVNAATAAAAAVENLNNAQQILVETLTTSGVRNEKTNEAKSTLNSALASAQTAVGSSNNAIITFMTALSATGEDAWIAAGLAAQAADEAEKAAPDQEEKKIGSSETADITVQLPPPPPTPERYLGQ
jgi:chromosome segregation ATPase